MTFKKGRFDELYDQRDPLALLESLVRLNYTLNVNIYESFHGLVKLIETQNVFPRELCILDVCSSYGFNSAVLAFDESLSAWCARLTKITHDDRLESDRTYFLGKKQLRSGLRFYGMDKSAKAIEYGVAVGLLQGGWICDLEVSGTCTEIGNTNVRSIDIVVCTGAIGYIGARTIREVRNKHPEAFFLFSVMEGIDATEVYEVFNIAGYQLEAATPGRVIQRRRTPEEGSEVVGEDSRYADEASKFIYAAVYLASPPVPQPQ